MAQVKAEEETPRSDNEWLICTGIFGGFDKRGDALVRGPQGETIVCMVALDGFGPFIKYFEDDPIRVLGYRDRKGKPGRAYLRGCYPVK